MGPQGPDNEPAEVATGLWDTAMRTGAGGGWPARRERGSDVNGYRRIRL